MIEVKPEVRNVVMKVTYEGVELDPDELTGILDGARYDPINFPGVIYKSEDPRASFLIFKTGRVICAGANSIENAERAVGKLTERLRRSGVEIAEEPTTEVKNMVATIEFDRKFDLNKIAKEFRTAEYEPEVFPGLVFRMDEPKVVFLIFATGKMICAGAESIEDIEKATEKIMKELS